MKADLEFTIIWIDGKKSNGFQSYSYCLAPKVACALLFVHFNLCSSTALATNRSVKRNLSAGWWSSTFNRENRVIAYAFLFCSLCFFSFLQPQGLSTNSSSHKAPPGLSLVFMVTRNQIHIGRAGKRGEKCSVILEPLYFHKSRSQTPYTKTPGSCFNFRKIRRICLL